MIQKAAVPKIRFHDLRHTHAKLLLAKGVNVKVILNAWDTVTSKSH
nr:hypothetical protein [Bacillus sp. AR2-1]